MCRGTVYVEREEMSARKGDRVGGKGRQWQLWRRYEESDGVIDCVVWSGVAGGKEKVAVKFLQKIDEETLRETKKELSFLGSFRHERIVSHLLFVNGK